MTMNSSSSQNPETLWNTFEWINSHPRASKKEEALRVAISERLRQAGIEHRIDSAGNIIALKPGSPGKEQHPPLALQAHLDMVHQKNSYTVFDFETQGIESYRDGDWLRAKGTTLGADNGLGLAMILAVLLDPNAVHPPLEALLTVDEESGMGGAKGLERSALSAKRLLNLDTEEDDEITIGCAGGIDTTLYAEFPTEHIQNQTDYIAFEVSISGLSGGHSGTDIHLGRGNANKLLFRCLNNLLNRDLAIRLVSWNGGGLRNAIPREAKAQIAVAAGDQHRVRALWNEATAEIQTEYARTDPEFRSEIMAVEANGTAMNERDSARWIRAGHGCPDGIGRMSAEVQGLVETSSNLAFVSLENGLFTSKSLQRSAIQSAKWAMAQSVAASFESIGARAEYSGDYPGWAPDPNSDLVRETARLHGEFYGRAPKILACHAGLECGLIGEKHPGMQMVSIGPTIRNAHSPDECAHIESAERFLGFFHSILHAL